MRCARGGSTEAGSGAVESLYLLIPLSIVLVLAIGAVLVWAVMSGQFDGLEAEGERILEQDATAEARADDPDSPR
jgi:cbb3-type cytochrome oxidase maturation protein